VADRLEESVAHVLNLGYRTGDLMFPGCNPKYEQIGCSKVGDVIAENLQNTMW
jgi:hypothetical protein